MVTTVSKSRFKARALAYFREVELSGRELVITDRGRPVLRLIAYRTDPSEPLHALRETVVKYDAPTEPVGQADWDAGK
jgi:antitoxin (DNA-binding transcriptional repressor) of toxin-antitoxin stability system